MSDSSPLNTLSGENKNEIFEKLCKEISQEIDHHRRTKILHSCVQTYLLNYKEQIEANISSEQLLELLSEIPLLCSRFLQTSRGAITTRDFENKSQNLESASLCFDVVLACLEALSVAHQLTSIIKISLNILFQGYTHCKESEVIYGDLLEQFADELGNFFKKIESLQLLVLQQLDKLSIERCLAKDPQINCIVLEMGNLCQVVFSLDADIAFDLWAKYKRIITDHSSLKEISNIDSVSTHLASKNVEILQVIKDMTSEDRNSEEDEELAAKLVFYLDALSTMLSLARDSIKGNIPVFRTFLIGLFDCLISCYSSFILDQTSNFSYLDIIKSCLVKNAFALLSNLYAYEEFLKMLLLCEADKSTNICNFLLKLCSLQFLENASLQLKKEAFKDLFQDFSSGNTEDNMKFLWTTLPRSTVSKTDSDESVTIYQFAYEQITEFLKLLPDSVIEEMESTIVGYLVLSSDMAYLLISDVWMYRLRCSDIEFLKDRCYFVVQSSFLQDVNNIGIQNFLKRMLRFLPTLYKDRLLEEFSTLKVIFDTDSIEHRYGMPHCTSADEEIFTYSEENVKTLMQKLNEDFYNDDPVQLVQKACLCLELCTYFLNASNSSQTLQFIQLASELFKSNVYEIQIAVLTLIKALSKKFIPEHTEEFGEMVTFLAQLFSEAMNTKNYIVKYEARNIFSYFAKNTPHTKIVSETVRRDPSLKPIMKSYINALPDNNFLTEKEKATHLKMLMSTKNSVKLEIPQAAVVYLQQFFSNVNFKLLA